MTAGTVLGYVGNTGNARTTNPHLHLGIYAGEAIDPLPFLAADQDVPASPAPTLSLGSLARVQPRRLDLRAGATGQATRIASLDGGTLLLVSGAVSTWIRVQLPDGTSGYVARQGVVAADTPLQQPRVPAGSVLRQRPLDTATPLGAPRPGAARRSAGSVWRLRLRPDEHGRDGLVAARLTQRWAPDRLTGCGWLTEMRCYADASPC